jgi:predicted RNA-binding protein (virulence factor B family)
MAAEHQQSSSSGSKISVFIFLSRKDKTFATA